jgi:hypothetical protein
VNTGDVFDYSPAPVAGTAAQTQYLYQTERYRYDGINIPNMVYTLNVPFAQTYLVRLHFAEMFIYNAFAGVRVFNVAIESNTVLANFDIFADAGYATATIKQFLATVNDGAVTITFTAIPGKDQPKISAIEVIAQ